jgi:hypothetical protein
MTTLTVGRLGPAGSMDTLGTELLPETTALLAVVTASAEGTDRRIRAQYGYSR